jgi:hypothetical protein
VERSTRELSVSRCIPAITHKCFCIFLGFYFYLQRRHARTRAAEYPRGKRLTLYTRDYSQVFLSFLRFLFLSTTTTCQAR